MRRLVLVTVLSVVGSLATTGVAAAKSDVCALLTKKQASKALGLKVVELERDEEPSTGAKECEYRSAQYANERLEGLDAPIKLQITTQPLTDDVADALDDLEADVDAEAVAGLGDRAFYTSANDLLAVVGDVVVQAEVTNVEWAGDELDTLIRDPELAAMRKVVAKLAKARR